MNNCNKMDYYKIPKRKLLKTKTHQTSTKFNAFINIMQKTKLYQALIFPLY